MAEEEPLARLVLEVLRRRRKASLNDILREIFIEVRREYVERARRVLERLEMAGLVVKHVEPVKGPVFRYVWYDARPLRRLALRPGLRLTKRDISIRLGIPLEDVEKLIQFAKERRWLIEVQPEVYETQRRIWRVQKMKIYSTRKNPQAYQVRLMEVEEIPRQVVLAGLARSEFTDELEVGTHGAVRVVVYTTNPDAWPEERLSRIMRGLFAEEGISLEMYSNLPYISTFQAYEREELEPDEVPEGVELDEVQVIVYFSLHTGAKYVYIFTRKPWGWAYERYEVS